MGRSKVLSGEFCLPDLEGEGITEGITIHLFMMRGAKTKIFCWLRFCIFEANIFFCVQSCSAEANFHFHFCLRLEIMAILII